MTAAAKSVAAGLLCSVIFMSVLCCVCNPQYMGGKCRDFLSRIGIHCATDPLHDAASWQQVIYPKLHVFPEQHANPFSFSCTLHILPQEIVPENPPPLRLMRVRCGNAIFEISEVLDPDPTALGLFPGVDTSGKSLDEGEYAIYEASISSDSTAAIDSPLPDHRSRTFIVLSKATGWSRKIPISISTTAPDENGIVVATYAMEGVKPFSMPLDMPTECEAVSIEVAVGPHTAPDGFCAFRDLQCYGQPLDLTAYREDWDAPDLATIGQADDLFVIVCPAGITPPIIAE